MILPDVNLLIYAYNEADPRFARAKSWFENLLSSDESTGFCWETLNGFIRVSTNTNAVPAPLSLVQAFDAVQSWLELPNVALLKPKPNHLEILRKTSFDAEAVGRRYADAVLAAYAISHNAVFASSDKHFRMFKGLQLIDPLSDS